MKVNFNYNEELSELDSMISNMPKQLENQEKTVLQRIGASVKKSVEKYLYNSNIEQRAKETLPSNFDGSRPYVHMKNDVKYNVKKSKDGRLYVSVRGGRFTGYKWHLLNDGHFTKGGSFVQGTNFMDKAISNSSGEVERIIHDMMKKVVDS